jgi:hypothetical protein
MQVIKIELLLARRKTDLHPLEKIALIQ